MYLNTSHPTKPLPGVGSDKEPYPTGVVRSAVCTANVIKKNYFTKSPGKFSRPRGSMRCFDQKTKVTPSVSPINIKRDTPLGAPRYFSVYTTLL